MRPFMASVAVIFGVDFTGPHILVVKLPLNLRGNAPATMWRLIFGYDSPQEVIRSWLRHGSSGEAFIPNLGTYEHISGAESTFQSGSGATFCAITRRNNEPDPQTFACTKLLLFT
jgi:hypothetical protein